MNPSSSESQSSAGLPKLSSVDDILALPEDISDAELAILLEPFLPAARDPFAGAAVATVDLGGGRTVAESDFKKQLAALAQVLGKQK